MNPKMHVRLWMVALFGLLLGCTQPIPQAHRGRVFNKTGAWALFIGGKGFEGPILGPSTVYVGVYNEVLMVDCTQKTSKETLQALTKDGVQFSLDIYLRYGANCADDEAVSSILSKFTPGWQDSPEHPEWKHVIFGSQLHDTYLRPALGEAVRVSVSPYIANDINAKREEIFENMKVRFREKLADGAKLVIVYEANLSNLDFPDSMDKANEARAVQAILKDKAIAERERVNAEIETAKSRRILAEADGDTEAGRIDRIGAALRRNPEYLTFDLQTKLPGIYQTAGEKGNLIIAGPSPSVIVTTPAPKAK